MVGLVCIVNFLKFLLGRKECGVVDYSAAEANKIKAKEKGKRKKMIRPSTPSRVVCALAVVLCYRLI